MPRGEISFADFLSAVHDLKADEETAAQIVSMLGLEQTLTRFGRSKPGAYEAQPAPTATVPSAPTPPPSPAQVRPPSSEVESPVLPASLSQIQSVGKSTSPPPWLNDASVESLRPASSKSHLRTVVIDPLFVPLSQRAILSASLATQANEGEIDVETLVAMRSELRAVYSLPRLPSATLRRGVQVLLDDSSGFTPYSIDRERISRAISEVVGRNMVTSYHFRGSPERGVFQPRRKREPWVPPHSGTVIAVVSDLGLGGPFLSSECAEVSEWMQVLRKAERAKCPVVVFNPLAPKRWPAKLAHMVTIVHWDRKTTVRSVKRALPKGHKSLP